MDVVYGLIPMMLIFGFLVVLVFIWMAKSGHFDDLDGDAHSIFMDDEDDIDAHQNPHQDAKKPAGDHETRSAQGLDTNSDVVSSDAHNKPHKNTDDGQAVQQAHQSQGTQKRHPSSQ